MNLIAGNIYVYYCAWLDPPHDKIGLCICDQRNWVFWFNSEARFHGIAQLPIAARSHAAIPKDCFLDLAGVKVLSAAEIAVAEDKGPINEALRSLIKGALGSPIKRLPELHRQQALNVL